MITDTTVPASAVPLTDFFSAMEARFDRWRQISAVVRAWQGASGQSERADALFEEALGLFGEVAVLEAFYAYPGPRLMAAIEEALAERNAGACLRLVQRVSSALLNGSYRQGPAAWDPLQSEALPVPDAVPPDGQVANGHVPYFEVLIVTPDRSRHSGSARGSS